MTLSLLTASALAVPTIVALALPVLLGIVVLRKSDQDRSREGFVPVFVREQRPEARRGYRNERD